MTLRIRPASEVLAEQLAADPLKDFFSWWDAVTESDYRALSGALEEARREEDVQQFLQEPRMLNSASRRRPWPMGNPQAAAGK